MWEDKPLPLSDASLLGCGVKADIVKYTANSRFMKYSKVSFPCSYTGFSVLYIPRICCT